MEFLKKRQGAFAVLAAVIVIFTVLGVHLSLNRQVAKLDRMFTDGIYIEKDNYTQPGIESYLEARIKDSLGLLTIAANYENLSSETETLREARHALMDAVGISQKYAANQKLEDAYKALSAGFETLDLSGTDAQAVSTYVSNLSGAQKAIGESVYNARVSDYENNILGVFPVSILRTVAFPDNPEYFGVEN